MDSSDLSDVSDVDDVSDVSDVSDMSEVSEDSGSSSGLASDTSSLSSTLRGSDSDHSLSTNSDVEQDLSMDGTTTSLDTDQSSIIVVSDDDEPFILESAFTDSPTVHIIYTGQSSGVSDEEDDDDYDYLMNDDLGASTEVIHRNTLEYVYKSPVNEQLNNSMALSSSCAICMSEFADSEMVRRLRCMHLFHSECVGHWLKDKSICPVCRTKIAE